MSIPAKFGGAMYAHSTIRRLMVCIAMMSLTIFFSACGSGSTVLGGATATTPATASTSSTGVTSTGATASGTTSTNNATSGEVNKAGGSTNITGTTTTGTTTIPVTGTTTGTGTGTGTGNSTGTTTTTSSSSSVTPSFATDPLTAFKRLVNDIAMLNEFDMFFFEPVDGVAPTTSTGQDFRYINCAPTPRVCNGTVSLTRTYNTPGTFTDISAGTSHAFSYQSYLSHQFIQHGVLTGTAYLTFPDGFTISNGTYRGKTSLYIRLKAPGPVIEWEGSVTASNFKNESSPTHNLSGNLEVSPNGQPTWALNISLWRTYGVVLEGSQLTLTESGQSAEIIVESASSDESIIRMSYSLSGQASTVRIKQSNMAGVLSYTLL
jgi:hypothetical protein